MTSVLLVTGLVEGGIGAHVADLAAGLVEAGHTVRVAAPRSVITSFGLDGVGEVVEIEVGSRPAPRDVAALAVLRAQLHDVDVVHAHGLRAGALAVLARATLSVGTRRERWRRRSTKSGSTRRRRGERSRPSLVVTSHNAAPVGGSTRAVYRALEAIVLRGADDVLVVSPDLHQAAAATSKGHRRRATISLAVVGAPQTTVARSAHEVRSQLSVDPADRLVVSVGRLAPQKAHQRFIDAVATCAQQGFGLDAVIVGEGPQREDLQALIDATRAPVRLLGRRSDVPDLLAAADIVVSAARWEGQPVWLQEALAVGSAIVATDVGGTAVVLGDGGALVDAEGTDHAVAQRLSYSLGELLGDERARLTLQTRARLRAAQLPDRQGVTKAALDIYRRAAPYEA